MTAAWTFVSEFAANLAAWWPAAAEGVALPDLYLRGTAGAWIVVAYARWVYPALVVGSLLLAAGTWLARRKLGWFGVGLAWCAAILVLGLFAPRAALDVASVDADHMAVTQATWLGEFQAPRAWTVSFADLESLELAEEPLGPLGRWLPSRYLVCRDRIGQETWVPIQGLVAAVLPDLRRAAEARGVIWRDQFDRRLKQTASVAPATPAGTR